MGLFDKIKSKFVSADGKLTPPPASFATRPDTVYAPLTGMLVSLQEVNDEVIPAGLLGVGYGIVPTTSTGVIYSPVSGHVGATTVTNHSIIIAADNGMEVLVHVGIGTVNMGGKGFTALVSMGDEVVAGQPLLAFDDDSIKLAGYDDVVTCTITNADKFDRVDRVGDSGTLIGGRPLVKIGDPLLVARSE